MCRELGIGVTAYGVLSRGLLSGSWTPRPGDMRAALPRFQGDNLARDAALVESLRRVAEAKGVTLTQLAIAWVLARGSDVVPLVGARRRDRLAEALLACDVTLTSDEMAAIEDAVPAASVAGERYAAAQFALLDSEP